MCRVAVSGGLILWYPLAAHCGSTWEAAYNCIKIIYRPDWGYLYRVFMGYINCCIPIFNRCNPMQPPFHVRCGTPLAHARAPNSRVWPAHCRMCTLTTGMSHQRQPQFLPSAKQPKVPRQKLRVKSTKCGKMTNFWLWFSYNSIGWSNPDTWGVKFVICIFPSVERNIEQIARSIFWRWTFEPHVSYQKILW